MSDSTLETAERLVKKAMTSAAQTPISKDPDANQLFGSLSSCGDKELLPIFQKLRQGKVLENQIYGMVTSALLAKQAGLDPEKNETNFVDIKLLFSTKDMGFIGLAISRLIDAQALSVAQLREIVASAPDGAFRSMAAGELARLKKLDDRAPLVELLKSDTPIISYYAAITMLQSDDPKDQKAGLARLTELSGDHDLRQAPIQALMLVRMQKDKIKAGIPWATKIAADEEFDMGLRYTAVSCLLSLGGPDGPQILGDMIQKQKDYTEQVKLALIALENGGQLTRQTIAPLAASKSSLVKSLAIAAQKAADKADPTPDLLALIKEGHPIVLDWSLAYADRAAPESRLAIRLAIIQQANIVDGVRDRDYERAALAAQSILDTDGDAGRKTLEGVLKSDNRAAVEAALAGIYRSSTGDQSTLILNSKVWEGLTRTTSTEIAANYAALILAREGHKETLAWLPGMVLGGSSQGPNFRALAGWYYAKLNGQAEAFLKAVLAE